jgi:hypothetical protein
MRYRLFLLRVFVVWIALSASSQAWARPANVWHIPDNLEINGGSTHMRDPWVEIRKDPDPNNPTTITIYQGVYLGNGENEINGGFVYYKGQSQNNWSMAPITFAQPGPSGSNNAYWSASFQTNPIDANKLYDVIQYFIYVKTDGASGFNSTYIYAPIGGGDHASTTVEEGGNAFNIAVGSPFTIRNRAGWIFHANNRVVALPSDLNSAHSNVQFWAKVGYITNVNDLSTKWVTNGAVYYTIDGSTPVPGNNPGIAGNASTQVAAFSYDHPENTTGQNGGTPSIAGTAMWWQAVAPNLPTFTTIKYKVGFWNPANNEQKFGDYNAGDGTDYQGHVFSFSIGTSGDPVLTVSSPTIGALNANYTTSHVFVDEIAGDSIPFIITFQPNAQNVDPSTVQVYTNLNRRDYAMLTWTDSFGIATEEGINPPSGDVVGTDDSHYYKAYGMTQVDPLTYTVTLNAQKTGAYRLTARYKTKDPNTQVQSGWNYFTTPNGRRDHALVVSPIQSRNIQLYELNTLNLNANGDQAYQRGTFNDLIPGGGKSTRGNVNEPVADLNYIKNLGCNWVWFQPIHPNGIDGRQDYPNSTTPYNVGSPYSVKNFFEVMPLMAPDSGSFSGGNDPAGNDTAAGRAQARQSFHDFVATADNASVGVMLDAPFNHTSFDGEFGTSGPLSGTTLNGIANMNNLIKPGTNPTDQIRNNEARFYSLADDYAQRASSSANIALAPDRYDFGKWPDVHDIYFGTYSSLVTNSNTSGNYTNENDAFFGYFGNSPYPSGDPNWTSTDFSFSNANNNITRNVWKYFAQYVPYWLSQTGHVDGNGNLIGNTTSGSGDYATRLALDSRGIDGLRADFGQGLPPQCWEYIINVARSFKWNFVFMTESLDGDAVTYRSNRHFDILNESIIFPFQSASQTTDYRSIFEGRRGAYGQGLVLLNNLSHDEQAYADPFQALIRFAVASTNDGVPMIFYGEENGISQTFGFSQYETNFGKQIAHFKVFNGLGPILGNQTFALRQLYPVYAAINQGRQFSPALRSSNRWFLNLENTTNHTDTGAAHSAIFSVAKYEAANASPGLKDVVFGFVNLDRNNPHPDPAHPEFNENTTFYVNISQNSGNLFGINQGRNYNIKNVAAYTGQDPNRRNYWLWSNSPQSPTPGRTGMDVLSNGITVLMNKVPASNGGWSTAPYEAQYLKLYDIDAPNTPAPNPQVANSYGYAIGNSVTFTWTADPNVNAVYAVTVTVNGGTPFTVSTTGTSYTYTGMVGDVISIVVRATNPDNGSAQSSTSNSTPPVKLLNPNGDDDGDGMTNAAEDLAGTNPFDPNSALRMMTLSQPTSNSVTLTWETVPGKKYQVQSAPSAGGTYTGVGPVMTAGPNQFTLNETVSGAQLIFYRVALVP